jgi:hypothetical protein
MLLGKVPTLPPPQQVGRKSAGNTAERGGRAGLVSGCPMLKLTEVTELVKNAYLKKIRMEKMLFLYNSFHCFSR